MIDQLEDLIVDEESVNKELLSTTLKPFIRIVRENKQFTFTSEFTSLEPKQKMIVFLLGQKAKKILGFIEDEKTTPKIIASEIGLREGTVYPYARELEKATLLKNDNGRYFIPNYAFEQVKNYLAKKVIK